MVAFRDDIRREDKRHLLAERTALPQSRLADIAQHPLREFPALAIRRHARQRLGQLLGRHRRTRPDGKPVWEDV